MNRPSLLPLAQVRGNLRRHPTALRMEERSRPGGGLLRWEGTMAGAVLLGVGLLVAPWRGRRG
jgi:hypothetical protein